MGEPSPNISDEMYDTLEKIKEAIKEEGLSIPSFIHLANQVANWHFFATCKDSTPIEKTVEIFNFIQSKNMTVLRFLRLLLKREHVQLAPYCTEWLPANNSQRGRIIIILDMIKGLLYSSGNGDTLWKLYIAREVSARQNALF
ncbi:hypothetical protein DFH28DRAFT_898204 [Melampsora americana]|nr:hypothetical protein DFH28DRAFT_898204 [Melampsora americana]